MIAIPQLIFLFIAALAVVAALNVIFQRNPLYSALALIVTMCALAGNFLLLQAQFVAVMQVIVYAGAIMVLFVFVIMLLNIRSEEARRDRVKYLRMVAPLLLIGVIAECSLILKGLNNPPAKAIAADGSQAFGTIESIGQGLFSTYLFPFEATSVLILMAMVGAMVLARKRTIEEAETLGRILDESNRSLAGSPSEMLEKSDKEVAA